MPSSLQTRTLRISHSTTLQSPLHIYSWLSLVPLCVASTSALQGIALGLFSCVVLFVGSLIILPLAGRLHPRMRIPISLLIAGTMIVCLQMLLSAYLHELYMAVGAYTPLLVTAFIGVNLNDPPPQSVGLAAKNGGLLGAAAFWFMTGIGLLREALSHGGIFLDAVAVFGKGGATLTTHFTSTEQWALLAGLPTGGFLIVGLTLVVFSLRFRSIDAPDS